MNASAPIRSADTDLELWLAQQNIWGGSDDQKLACSPACATYASDSPAITPLTVIASGAPFGAVSCPWTNAHGIQAARGSTWSHVADWSSVPAGPSEDELTRGLAGWPMRLPNGPIRYRRRSAAPLAAEARPLSADANPASGKVRKLCPDGG